MPIPALVPEPRQIKFLVGSWNMPAAIVIATNISGRSVASFLKKILETEWEIEVQARELDYPNEHAILHLSAQEIFPSRSGIHPFPPPPEELHFGENTATRKYFPGEEYWFSITPEHVLIRGASPRGLFYGVQTLLQILRQVSPSQIPCCEVHDWPALEIRGAHVDLKDQYQTIDYYKSLFHRFAEWKLNVVLLELEDKFPFQQYTEMVSPNALFSPLLEELLAEADRLFLEVIPLQQAMSHLKWLLGHPTLESLAENPKAKDLELCPSNPMAVALSKSLYDEICNAFPGRFIHIGGDEHRNLGFCARCSAFVQKHSKGVAYAKGELYGKFLTEIASYIRSKGKIPIAWSDIALSCPSALDFIPPGSILFHYWEYDVSNQGPIRPEDYDPEFCIRTPANDRLDWVRVGGSKYNATDLALIPEDLRSYFSQYILPDETGTFPAYPYYAFFRDKKYEVIAGPATQCCQRTPDLPHYCQHHPNLRLHGRVAKTTGALGYITTNWVIRGVPLECSVYGFAMGAEAAWNPDALKSIFGFYRRFGKTYFGVSDERWVAILPRMGILFYPKREQYWADMTAGAGKILEELTSKVTRNVLTFNFLRWAYSHRTLELKITRGLDVVESTIIAVDEGERPTLNSDECGAFIDDLLSLIDQVAMIHDVTAQLFRHTYHQGEIADELERRFLQKKDYLEQLVDLLQDYPHTHDALINIIIARHATRWD